MTCARIFATHATTRLRVPAWLHPRVALLTAELVKTAVTARDSLDVITLQLSRRERELLQVDLWNPAGNTATPPAVQALSQQWGHYQAAGGGTVLWCVVALRQTPDMAALIHQPPRAALPKVTGRTLSAAVTQAHALARTL